MSKERFEEIREQIADLAEEAVDILPADEQDRARGYWYAHIMGALGGDYNSYLGGSFIDMESSLKSFDEAEPCDECEEEDCEGCEYA